MSDTPRKRKTLQYYLEKLQETHNSDITIFLDWPWNNHTPETETWEVTIGDHHTWADYWQKQPLGMGRHKKLREAIKRALAEYERSQLQFIMDDLK